MKKNLENLERLGALLNDGVITEEEFNYQKSKLLSTSTFTLSNNLFGLNENTYCFLIHISVLLGFVHLLLGLVVPIILWTLNRENNPTIDQHGRNVLNWILSFTIYLLITTIIIFPMNNFMQFPMSHSFNLNALPSLFTGIFPVTILMILNVLFILIGALKASTGKLWKYPLSIRFFKKAGLA
ncbi:hypothetical protein SAMN04489724_4288 [Algoriphagus locisalis]|uniref:SHOCT domain-containing protein n=1 Tax=Algoriphagus locisalis TaxID=305507 RepID=A0A1I7DQE9_9BACT|nr:DUF4870 domain-containing protein [Algoriphagus locisalis]SFU13897.1 hypothetical protein SAMN04489724_4288 [Algoriphagus locisalis]